MDSYFTDADRLRYVNNGQLVMAPFGDKGAALRCIVVKACGNTALVENAERGLSQWVDVSDLFPNITDEQMAAWRKRGERNPHPQPPCPQGGSNTGEPAPNQHSPQSGANMTAIEILEKIPPEYHTRDVVGLAASVAENPAQVGVLTDALADAGYYDVPTFRSLHFRGALQGVLAITEPNDYYGSEVKCVVRRLPDGYELKWGAMYAAPPFNTTRLFALAELFGTDNIDVDNYSQGGCDTCDYGSDYGHTFQIRGATRNTEFLETNMGEDLFA